MAAYPRIRGDWEFFNGDVNFIYHGGLLIWSPSPNPDEHFFLDFTPWELAGEPANGRVRVSVYYTSLALTPLEEWVNALHASCIHELPDEDDLARQVVAVALAEYGLRATLYEQLYRNLRSAAAPKADGRATVRRALADKTRSFLGDVCNRLGTTWAESLRGDHLAPLRTNRQVIEDGQGRAVATREEVPRDRVFAELMKRISPATPVPEQDRPSAEKLARMRELLKTTSRGRLAGLVR